MSLDTGMLHLHNFLRWVILILLLVALAKSISGMSGNKPYTSGDRKLGAFLMISCHIMLLIGIYQLLAGRYGILTASLPEGTSFMKDKFYRFFWLEHPLMMFIAIILITIGRGSFRKPIPDRAKHKRSFWFYFIALILILAAVPWPFREIVARPLFPGMPIN